MEQFPLCLEKALFMDHNCFSPWNPAVHEEAKEKMFAHKRRPEDYSKALPVSGLSWVKPGSTQPFSKEDNPLQT